MTGKRQRARKRLVCAGVLAMAACVLAPLARAADPVTAERRLVVAANPHASEAGIRILRAGGSAADAAIAVQLVLSLVEPQSSGIGGGAFALYLDAAAEDSPRDARIRAYQGRERAPSAATPELFLDADGEPLSFFEAGFGGLAVGVPGVMRMLETLHRDQGRLPWAELFDPAIELAEQGFEISPRLFSLLERFKRFAEAEGFREHYFDADGEPYPVGHTLVNADYAETLELLAERGADVMYTGELAREIVAAVRDNDLRAGHLTLEDLEAYEAERLEPLCSPYREWRVCGPRLPSSGGVTTQQILGMLGHFELAGAPGSDVRALHLVAEASRLAFADRGLYLADPEFVDVPVAELLGAGYLRERASLISDARAMDAAEPGRPLARAAWHYSPSPPSEVQSTSHFSIVDEWGDAVSMTSSVQSAFGSQLMVGGFLLNNQLTDFSFVPERDGEPVANRPGPRKRPLSSMSPTIVLDGDGRMRLVVGSPGGTRIINYVTQALVGVLDGGLDVQAAVEAPHFVAQDGPIELEEGTELVELGGELEALGHRVVPRGLNSGLHGIAVDYGESGRVLSGGADPRREGVAIGD